MTVELTGWQEIKREQEVRKESLTHFSREAQNSSLLLLLLTVSLSSHRKSIYSRPIYFLPLGHLSFE